MKLFWNTGLNYVGDLWEFVGVLWAVDGRTLGDVYRLVFWRLGFCFSQTGVWRSTDKTHHTHTKTIIDVAFTREARGL